MKPGELKCVDCRWWVKAEEKSLGAIVGECHRHPPAVLLAESKLGGPPQKICCLPVTTKDNWCSELDMKEAT